MPDYRMPDGSTPVLLSADSADALRREAAALAAYLVERPRLTPDAVADMLLRTRGPRRFRALAMVSDIDQLLDALRAVADGRPHPAVATGAGAAARRIAYVFPGQGSQRPGMGLLYYRHSPAFRAAVEECDAMFRKLHDISPLRYLVHEDGQAREGVEIVQPALFMQMLGLAAMWRAVGVEPDVTIGHSQGEIAAAVASGAISLADGVQVVAVRARIVSETELEHGWDRHWAMAVLGVDRDECEALLARNSGWAELAVVNSAHILAISGERTAISELVAQVNAQGKFAKEIRVEYPAHTSFVSKYRGVLEVELGDTLENPEFNDTEIPCLGGTLGDAITPDVSCAEYWYWNLRNRVRFDLAVAAAAAREVDVFVEIADHPALVLAMQETLHGVAGKREFLTVGTSRRSATDLHEFSRNLAQVAVADAGFSWAALRDPASDTVRLPLLDFPNTQTNSKRLWAPYMSEAELASGGAPAQDTVVPQRLVERWVRLERRKLVPPRTFAVVDHTGRGAELAAALSAAASRHGAAAVGIGDAAGPDDTAGGAVHDTVVVLAPAPAASGLAAAVAESAAFLGDPGLLSNLHGARDVWLVTVGGEQVLGTDVPDPAHAAFQAGFRCLAMESVGTVFRHVDLEAGAGAAEAAKALVGAIHTAGEPELAVRAGKVYAKRLAVDDGAADRPLTPADLAEVVIVGGTGKLGLDFCADFARSGARRITLISRSGGSAAVRQRVRELNGVAAIDIRICDVTDEAAVLELAESYRATPVSLLVHAAVDYAAAAADRSADTVRAAAESKVIAADRLIRTLPMTPGARVLLCSSLSATVGGRGHAVYAAVNRMLDAAATGHRNAGVDVTSVQWGLWRAVGADHADALAKISGSGLAPMDPAGAIAAGFAARANSIVAAADWSKLRSVFALFGYEALFTDLPDAAPRAQPPEQAAAEQAGEQPPAAAAPAGDIASQVQEALRHVMGLEAAETIDGSVPLVALGLDSLQALDLRKRIETGLQRDLPVTAILGGASLDEVVSLLG